MFDAIAARYDLLNRLMSFGMDAGWRRRAARALALEPGAYVLDLATGTGELAIAIASLDRETVVVGLDPSERMRALAEAKLERAGLARRVELVSGDAERLPFLAGSFDAVSIGFGLRNLPDRGRALGEMARVTRPGGRVAVLELSEPRDGLLAPLARLYVHTLVPWLGAALSGAREYRHLARSIAAFPPAAELAELMRASGLEVLEVVRLGFGACQLVVGTPKRRA